jgi:FKBP-type peptidyl-prolyl cis-trans isomerase SlyD
MPLKENQVVSINFTLKDNDGNVIQATTKEEPFSFLSGNEQILPKLEENIGGMLIGSKKTVVLEPENAYGNFSESAVRTVNKSEFPEGTELKVGMGYYADTPDGKQLPFTIKNIEGENITLDFNHPLAGKTLTFEVELLNLRDATQEELTHGHVHGAGGHHH